MNLGLRDKRALVAAASRGIGRACAELLVREGARVAICARDPAALERAATGVGAEGIRCDLASSTGPQHFIDEGTRRLGGLDILVTNSGGPPPGVFEEHGDDAWQRAVDLNLLSVVRLIRASVPYLREKGGRVVNLVSLAVKQPLPALVLSNSVRAAVIGLAKTLADELGPAGIAVNNVLPGRIATERIRLLDEMEAKRGGCLPEEVQKAYERLIPLGRYGKPEEVAALVIFLCSQQAAYINGATLLCDGGMHRGLM